MKLNAKIKQYGYKNSLNRAFKKVIRIVGIHFESLLTLKYLIDENELVKLMSNYDFSDIKELKYDDFLKGDSKVFTQKKLEIIKKRFQSNEFWAYGIIKNNSLVFSCWFNIGVFQYPYDLSRYFSLKKDEGMLQDSYCVPEYRERGYQTILTLYRLYKMKQMHLNKAFALILEDNIPSIRALVKSGFFPEKKVLYLKIFNKKYLFERKLS